jgi:hypothetical protein
MEFVRFKRGIAALLICHFEVHLLSIRFVGRGGLIG